MPMPELRHASSILGQFDQSPLSQHHLIGDWMACGRGLEQCSRMRILRFFQISKNMTFPFFEMTYQKVVKSH